MDLQATLFGRKCANVLPSPPESPSLYAYPPASGDRGRYIARLASSHVLPAPCNSAVCRSVESAQQGCNEKAAASQPQATPPRDGHTSPYSSGLLQITTAVGNSHSMSSNMRAPGLPSPDQVSDHSRMNGPSAQRPTRAFSSTTHPAPQVILTEAEHQSESDELLTGSEEEEEVAGGLENVKSSAERLVNKRKLKRFRLTHAQTRYLMSEFSRQAHPDAPQRERLSRNIPGLNPRQVQVWFQNRRAKLKRLTVDDQERMRMSRALPDDFDFNQTQYTFKEPQTSYGSALTVTDPLTLGGSISQRHDLRLGTGPLSIASNNANSFAINKAPSPISAIGSENPSPVSSINERHEYPGPRLPTTQFPLATNPWFTNPFGRSHSVSTGSPAFQREGRHSSQNSMMGLDDHPLTTTSPSNPSLTNNAYDYGTLPPLQFTRTTLQTRESQDSIRIQTNEGLPHDSGIAMNQNHLSPLSPPSSLCYDQCRMIYPSGSGFRASSYYQSSDTNLWQGCQPPAEAARPRAKSDTFLTYLDAQ